MRGYRHALIAAAAASAALTIGPLGIASASSRAPATGADHAVFVQTNDSAQNQILAFERRDDGRLIQVGAFDTGGRGATEVGAVADTLASQGSLAYDSTHGLLYAVNAGSDSLTVFSVSGQHLTRRQVINSGGPFPTS